MAFKGSFHLLQKSEKKISQARDLCWVKLNLIKFRFLKSAKHPILLIYLVVSTFRFLAFWLLLSRVAPYLVYYHELFDKTFCF